MTEKEKKLKRMEYLAEVLLKYRITEPKLSLDDIAEVLAMQIEDITLFLKAYRKELKKN